MTVELFYRDASDAERAIIAWLEPVEYEGDPLRMAVERKPSDPLPFVLVSELTATEDCQQISSYPLMSVRVLGSSIAQVKAVSSLVHRRMLVLADDPLQDIVLPDSSVVSVEWLETVERFHSEYYSDTVKQRCARYQMGVPFTDVEE